MTTTTTYPNGRIPEAGLARVATAPGQWLTAAAARQWDALARSVQAVHGWLPRLTDSYRPLDVQVRILRERYTTAPLFSTTGLTVANGGVRRYDGQVWYRKPGQATVATPGTSNHGLGLAVDVADLGGFSGARYAQLAALAPRFGFTNTEGRPIGEPWHWGFTGAITVTHPIDAHGNPLPATPAGTVPDPLTALTPEADVPIILKRQSTGVTYTLTVGHLVAHEDAEEQRVARFLADPQPGKGDDTYVHQVSDEDFHRALKAHGLGPLLAAWGDWKGTTAKLPAPGKAAVINPATGLVRVY